jgi:hypothetical protein
MGSPLFLEAWCDRVAGVSAFSNAITTAPLFGDGHRLVIADEDRKLKVRTLCFLRARQQLANASLSLVKQMSMVSSTAFRHSSCSFVTN